MPTHADAVELAAHMEWADALVWSTVLQSGPARGDEPIRTWLHHIHTVQRAFTSVWQNAPLQFVNIAAFADLPALAAWGHEGHGALEAYVRAADPAALERRVEMPWAARYAQSIGGGLTHPTLAQTIAHLSLHSAHHRGQVNARLRELGAEPPLTDHIAWIWRGQPAPAWPANVVASSARTAVT